MMAASRQKNEGQAIDEESHSRPTPNCHPEELGCPGKFPVGSPAVVEPMRKAGAPSRRRRIAPGEESRGGGVPHFYIYETWDTMNRNIESCWREEAREHGRSEDGFTSDPFSTVLWAERSLRHHRARVHNMTRAQIFVVPFWFGLSYEVGTCFETDHTERVQTVLDSLTSMELFQKRPQHHLVFLGHDLGRPSPIPGDDWVAQLSPFHQQIFARYHTPYSLV